MGKIQKYQHTAINKFGYALFAGVISLAYAETPGGFTGVQAFFLAFSAVFLAIRGLEAFVGGGVKNEQQQ